MIPQHLHESLKAACRMCIIAGNQVGDLNLQRWSTTYGNCGVEHVRVCWEHELTKLSREPQNTCEVQDD